MSFQLDNETTLRGFLAHIQANVRKLAALHFERNAHPDADKLVAVNPDLAAEWAILQRDVVKVLGTDAELKPYHELAGSGDFHTQDVARSGRDPFRIRFGVLKKQADKARLKDPSITLLKSWNTASRIREKEKC